MEEGIPDSSGLTVDILLLAQMRVIAERLTWNPAPSCKKLKRLHP